MPTHQRFVLGQTQRAPLMLPLAPYALYSVVRAYGYTGPCCQVRRTSDGATRQIGWKNNALSMDEVRAFLGSGAGTVATWYDQSGNNRHLTQGTAANQPSISLANATTGLCPITFDGVRDDGINKNLSVGSVSLSARAFTMLSMSRSRTSNSYNTFVVLRNGATIDYELISANINGLGLVSMDSADGFQGDVDPSYCPPMKPSLIGGVGASSSSRTRLDGETQTLGVLATGTATTIAIGDSSDGSNAYGNFDAFAYVFWNSALSSVNENLAAAALQAAIGWRPHRYQIIADGDSRTEGYGSTFLQSWPRQLQDRLGPDFLIRSLAINGWRAEDSAAVIDFITPVFDASLPRNIYVTNIGGADLGDGVSASTVYGYLQAIHAAARTAGFVSLQCTIPTSAGIDPGIQGQVDALNAAIRSGAGTDFDAVVDCQADSRLETPSDPTYFAADGVHYTTIGYAVWADLVRQAVMSLI